ncbi:MAG: AMP-binding protein, partial [Flavobacteriaceae bacterium]|nr:AMP-binding protein [Flavobacteriaceae bacterium]
MFWCCILGGVIPIYLDEKNHDKIESIAEVLDKFYLFKYKETSKETKSYPHKNIISIKHIDQEFPKDNEGVIWDGRKYEDPLFIQLSSGSTNRVPKLIPINTKQLNYHIYCFNKMNNWEYGYEFSLNWLPLDHVVPMIDIFRNIVNESPQLIVAKDNIIQNPSLWLDLITHYKISRTWAPNFGFQLLLNNLLQINNESNNWNLTSLKSVFNAGEQVNSLMISKLNEYLRRFGGISIKPAYGMAEMGSYITYANSNSITFYSSSFRLNPDDEIIYSEGGNVAIACVGKVMPGMKIIVTDIYGNKLKDKKIGYIKTKGVTLFNGYIGKNTNDFDDNGWYDTGDMGFIFNNELYITGRSKESLIINGTHYFNFDIENTIREIDGVRSTDIAVSIIKNSF